VAGDQGGNGWPREVRGARCAVCKAPHRMLLMKSAQPARYHSPPKPKVARISQWPDLFSISVTRAAVARIGNLPWDACAKSSAMRSSCCASLTHATDRCGTMSGHLPPSGGVFGYRSRIIKVSWRNGSSGSGARYKTGSGNRRIVARANRNGTRRWKHWLRSWSTV